MWVPEMTTFHKPVLHVSCVARLKAVITDGDTSKALTERYANEMKAMSMIRISQPSHFVLHIANGTKRVSLVKIFG